MQSITSSIRYLHRRIAPEITQHDWDAAFTRLHSLYAAISAHNSGYAVIVRSLELSPTVVPPEQFQCDFHTARAAADITLAAARTVRRRLGDMEVRLRDELRTLEEYEREYRTGLVLGRMRMSNGELDHVVAYTKSWGVNGEGGMGDEADRILREAGSWLVFEEVSGDEWEVVRVVVREEREKGIGAGGSGMKAGARVRRSSGYGVGEGELRQRRTGSWYM